METEEPASQREYALLESDDPSRFELVYEEVKKRKASEETYDSVEVVGTLTPDQIQRIARPYRHLSPDEDWVYNEDAWSSIDEKGKVEKGYRITRRPNDNPYVPTSDLRPARLDAELERQLLNRDDAIFRVVIQVRDFPEWDIPIMTREGFTSVVEYQRLQAERDAKIADRKALLTQKSQDISTYIISVNGTVLREAWSVGYLVVDIKKDDIRGLLNVNGVSVVESDYMPDDASQQGFFVGDHDLDTRTDVEDFFNEGYEGGQPNVGRHGYSDMLAAVIEANYFEDEACSFQEGANNCGNHSTDRIKGRWDCNYVWLSSCIPVSDYSASKEQNGATTCSGCTASHGTFVTTLIGGDYTQGQADGESLGDPAWTSGAHTGVWENTSSGMATEAYLLLLGGRYQSSSASQSAFHIVKTKHADIANASWGSTAAGCSPASSNIYEDELENAYDDGVFIVAAAGNNSGPSSSSCNVISPADTPKAFAVNGLGTHLTACEADYEACLTDTIYSARGATAITVNGAIKTAGLIDLTAPARVLRRTSWASGFPNGFVYDSTYGAGTSISSPIVGGAALVMKDFMLSDGNTFFNYPGRLQATMLAMGDGWSTVSGMDIYGGAGRLKTRLFDASANVNNRVTGPWTWRSKTYTFSSTGSTSFFINSVPMAAGTEFAKCVMWEGEDMSSKTDVSDIDLLMYLRLPYFGSCSSAGTLLAAWSDTSSDMRHKVRVESAGLAGLCMEVIVRRKHVTPSGATVNLFCYSAGEADHED